MKLPRIENWRRPGAFKSISIYRRKSQPATVASKSAVAHEIDIVSESRNRESTTAGVETNGEKPASVARQTIGVINDDLSRRRASLAHPIDAT